MATDLQQAESNLKRLEAMAPNMQSQLKDEVMKRFDYMKPFLGEVAQYERGVLPSYYETFANQGTGAADLSPAQQMAMAAREVGRKGQMADVARGVLSRQDQRAEEILRLLLGQFDLQMQAAQNAYQRAWNTQQARRGSGGGGGVVGGGGLDIIEKKLRELIGGSGGNTNIKPNPAKSNVQTPNVLTNTIKGAIPNIVSALGKKLFGNSSSGASGSW